jgi:hypothetical protein
VSESFSETSSRWCPDSSGGYQQILCSQSPSRPKIQREESAFESYACDFPATTNLDSQGVGCFPETGNDRLRIVGNGEDAPIGFDLQFDSFSLQPIDHIRRIPVMQWPRQGLLPSRIVGHEFPVIMAIMGHVASPSTGNLHLLKNVRGFFQDKDLPWRFGQLCAGDRCEKSGSASADYNQVELRMPGLQVQ